MNPRDWVTMLWYAVMWCPCYAIGQVLFRFQFTGKHHIPQTGPVLLVSNHQSNLDPVLVGVACSRQLKYLAKQGLFFFPLGIWIRALGAVPIDRHRGALAGIRATLELLKQNNAVLVFPEGSRTHDGKLQPMLPGFGLLARRSRATIVPLALDGAYDALPFGNFLVHPHPIGLTFGAPIPPAQYEHLTDPQLTELVSIRIEQALAATRQRFFQRSPNAGFRRAKPRNSLLAAHVVPAMAGETSI